MRENEKKTCEGEKHEKQNERACAGRGIPTGGVMFPTETLRLSERENEKQREKDSERHGE